MTNPRSCGVLLLKQDPQLSFLLMRHTDRWDLPKGHVDPDETDLQCALRELQEETGVSPEDIEIDLEFDFRLEYLVKDRAQPDQQVQKTLRIFLAWLRRDVPIQVTEHIGFEWIHWSPPHQIQPQTIDPLLQALTDYLGRPSHLSKGAS